MKNKLLKIRIISICCTVLLFILLIGSSSFNMILYFLLCNKSPSGKPDGDIEIIYTFDVLFSLFCGYLLFLLLRKIHIVDKR